MNTVSRQGLYGFTLIELMVTVAILAILAGIAIPIYTDYISTSRNTEAFNNMHSLALAEEEYYLENNTYVTGVSYNAVTKDYSLKTSPLGWSPAEPDNKQQFSYNVAKGASGGYSISAKGLGRNVDTSVALNLS